MVPAPRFRRVELGSPEPLPFDPEPAYLVIGSAEELSRFLGVHRWSPPIDWSREVLLVASRGECPTGGYTVAISRLERRPSETLKATVTFGDPAPTDFVTMVVTYPRAAVAVERDSVTGVSEVIFAGPGDDVLARVKVEL
ncbi:MAG: protease complex subunit PrcB family protein [Firmicutes bacterium]|nr:protease complex subunit PrcB family protein [Bacillota bacterium]